MNYDLLLFILFAVLFASQFAKTKLPRVLLTLIVIGLTARNTFDYQMKVYICRTEQEYIAQSFHESEDEQLCGPAKQAAHRYFTDRKNASYEKPFNRSYYSYFVEEKNKPLNPNDR